MRISVICMVCHLILAILYHKRAIFFKPFGAVLCYTLKKCFFLKGEFQMHRYKGTLRACFTGYIVQAVIGNFAPLLGWLWTVGVLYLTMGFRRFSHYY